MSASSFEPLHVQMICGCQRPNPTHGEKLVSDLNGGHQLQHKNFSVQEVSSSLLQSTSVAMYRYKGNTGNKAVEWHLN